MKIERTVLSQNRNVSMTMYLHDESEEFHFVKRPLMVVLPGGGYSVCSDREAEPIAMEYLAAGYQVCVLRYTLRDKGGWPYPLEDYDEAMDRIETSAEAWHIDTAHMAVIGFSAGGHLAACVATMARHKPAAAVLAYPVILQNVCDFYQPGMPNPIEFVDENTSPCFLIATRDDTTVRVNNALSFALALEKENVTFESHIYANGQHGFSSASSWLNTGELCPRLSGWIGQSVQWLGEIMGKLQGDGFVMPTIPSHINIERIV